jgi:hypothetical protein
MIKERSSGLSERIIVVKEYGEIGKGYDSIAFNVGVRVPAGTIARRCKTIVVDEN